MPAGPVIKRPNNGPWLALGAKIIGPKKPAEKEIPPINIAPVNIAAIIPIFPVLNDLQVYNPTINAIGAENHAAASSETAKNNGKKTTINKKVKSATEIESVERTSFFMSRMTSPARC